MELNITMVSISELKPYPRNARTHSDKQVQQIANSIKRFGFMNPVLMDDKGCILAGHGRVEAAKRLGLGSVPTIRAEHLNQAEKRAYILADNKIADNAGWDKDLLRVELKELGSLDLDFDLEITGFGTAEIDVIIDGPLSIGAVADEEEDIPEPELDKPAITQPGDIWQLGKHRLICGDALEPETYAALMEKKKAHMVFTDPPYNVPVNGHVGGLGKTKHREFAMASGEMSREEFTRFLSLVLGQLVQHTVNGSLHQVCMDWRHMGELQAAGDEHYSELKNLCVWVKDNGGMGSLYRSRHELVFVYKNGDGRHCNNVELGKHGRYRTNVWEYAGANSMRQGRMAELAMHPTVKPVAMVCDAIKDCTKRGELVLDAFGGSGTTLIAAEKTHRCARVIELDPHYCDVILRRWRDHTGEEPVHSASGDTFTQCILKEGGHGEG